MNTCTKCRTNIVPNSLFCVECGDRIELSQPSYQPPLPQQFPQPPPQYNPQSHIYSPQPHQYPAQYGYQQPHCVKQESMREPGRKLIFVVSILLTIFGALGALSSLSGCSFTSIPALERLLPDNILHVLRINMMFETISGIIMLTFGVCGIIMSKDSAKANIIMIFGVVLLVLNIIGGIWSFVLATVVFFSFEMLYVLDDYLRNHPFIDVAFIQNSAVANKVGIVLGTVLGSVLPILLIIGARRRKKGLMSK